MSGVKKTPKKVGGAGWGFNFTPMKKRTSSKSSKSSKSKTPVKKPKTKTPVKKGVKRTIKKVGIKGRPVRIPQNREQRVKGFLDYFKRTGGPLRKIK